MQKLDDQTVLESGDTMAVSHWSDSMGKRKVGKGRGKQGRQAQRNGQQNNNKRRQPAQIKGDHNQPQICQGANKSITNRTGTASENNEKITERAMTAAMNDRRGVKRKQEQTYTGMVLKSRMLGIQTAQSEEDKSCDRSEQRSGVRTRAMCRRQEEVEANLLGTKDTSGDSGPRGVG
jgi:hypothetical protein